MNTKITPITLGITNCYLIQNQDLILVDCGTPNQQAAFLKKLEAVAVNPKDIRLIVLTHGHYDHTGSAAQIKTITGAPLALHHGDAGAVQRGETIPVRGISTWGRILAAISQRVAFATRIPPLAIDLLLGDEGLSLEAYGIPGKIIATPGHTQGSTSLLLESGEAFVGDLAMAMAPLRFSPGLSIFGSDLELVKASCAKVLALGAHTIYPAHGKPFSAEVLRRVVG